MHADYDVIVAGAGSFGMSAGYYAAKAGARVLMIDSGDPPHTLGSHHGGTRIFRAAYTMGAAYVRLALRANALWHELEQDYASCVRSRISVRGRCSNVRESSVSVRSAPASSEASLRAASNSASRTGG